MKKCPSWLVFLLVIVGVPCGLCWLTTGFCGEMRYLRVVDVSPLYELPVPLKIQTVDDLAELDIFDHWTPYGPDGYLGEWRGRHPQFHTVKVYFEIFEDTRSAADSFSGECEYSGFNAQFWFEYGGEGENRYCVSYVQQYRASPDSFCTPLGKYISFVVFQKGNMVIRLWEETEDKDSTVKDEVIELLAEALGK